MEYNKLSGGKPRILDASGKGLGQASNVHFAGIKYGRVLLKVGGQKLCSEQVGGRKGILHDERSQRDVDGVDESGKTSSNDV
jgi:hypothetical protein